MSESRRSRSRRRGSLGSEHLLHSRGVSPNRSGYTSDHNRGILPQRESPRGRSPRSRISGPARTPCSTSPHSRQSRRDSGRVSVLPQINRGSPARQAPESLDSTVQVPSPVKNRATSIQYQREFSHEALLRDSSHDRYRQGRDAFLRPPVPQFQRTFSAPSKVSPCQNAEASNVVVDYDTTQLEPPERNRSQDSISHATMGAVRMPLGRSPSNLSLLSPFSDGIYQNRPLEGLSIRLIEILPARMSMIRCRIFTISFESPPPYLAISYAWGDPTDTCEIEIEGCLRRIPISLHGALKAVRQRDNSVCVWADALSIDQNNVNEKSKQIRLMPEVYSRAESVAIWLGPEADNSLKAVQFLVDIASLAQNRDAVSSFLQNGTKSGELESVVSLWERDYWRRLWVVQEVFNAKQIQVYCGSTIVPWDDYQLASDILSKHSSAIAFKTDWMGRKRCSASSDQYSYAQILVHQGPASLPKPRNWMGNGGESLLTALRACRKKLASDPKDKVFAILGILSEEVCNDIRVDYTCSMKEIYTTVFDYILTTTEMFDVICESIHFPPHSNPANLPSFMPDWSHIPIVASMGNKYDFSAATSIKARCGFFGGRKNKLEIAAIEIDTVTKKGIAVGTLCSVGDYLMAFLHWRAIILERCAREDAGYSKRVEEEFAETLCLGKVAPDHDSSEWLAYCYTIFANLLRERLPYLALDKHLKRPYLKYQVDVSPDMARELLQRDFADKMMGRCICITERFHLGMGSGFMMRGDIIVVPLGCSTPILLRAEGPPGEYRFVGDVYVKGYMHGEAIRDLTSGIRTLKKYVLH